MTSASIPLEGFREENSSAAAAEVLLSTEGLDCSRRRREGCEPAAHALARAAADALRGSIGGIRVLPRNFQYMRNFDKIEPLSVAAFVRAILHPAAVNSDDTFVLDVGANMGFYSVASRQPSGPEWLQSRCSRRV
jgi:hypothetical protein